MSNPLPLAASDRIAVIGLGYVGLPLAVALARQSGARIAGFDTNPARIADLKAGHDRTGVRLTSLWSPSTWLMRSRAPSLHSAIATRLPAAMRADTCLLTASNA